MKLAVGGGSIFFSSPVDFPLSLNGSPQPQSRFLLDVVELNPKVFRADTGNSLAQEGAVLF
jgi:hypothetical protein